MVRNPRQRDRDLAQLWQRLRAGHGGLKTRFHVEFRERGDVHVHGADLTLLGLGEQDGMGCESMRFGLNHLRIVPFFPVFR